MYVKRVYVFMLVTLLVQDFATGRKQKKSKSAKEAVDDANPQPNVLTYSNFEFNDVRSYDGFVPTFPDYTNVFLRNEQDKQKLYAPAFPSASDLDFNNNNKARNVNWEPFTSDEDGQVTSVSQHQPKPINDFSPPSFNSNDDTNKSTGFEGDYEPSTNSENGAVYGAKLRSINKNKYINRFNNTEFSGHSSSGLPFINADKPALFKNHAFQENKPKHSALEYNSQNLYNYDTSYPTAEIENSLKATPTNYLEFSKAFDFTEMQQPGLFAMENKYLDNSSKSSDSLINSMSDIILTDNYVDHNRNFIKIEPSFKNTLTYEYNSNSVENDSSKHTHNTNHDSPGKNNNLRNNLKSRKLNHKDQVNTKSWISKNFHDDKHKFEKSPLNGYEYGSNLSSTHVKYDTSDLKKYYNSNTDDFISPSINVLNSPNYQISETEYSNYITQPPINNFFTENNYAPGFNTQDFNNPSQVYLNKFKNFYTTSTLPTVTTAWGNMFKSTESSIYNPQWRKPQYNEEEKYDIIHIPKKLNRIKYSTQSDGTYNDWSYNSESYVNRPSKFHEPKTEWHKNVDNNKYQSEEDLLGLRNHDTSHPSYLPKYKYTQNDDSEDSFKRAVHRWRENYIKSKLKDGLPFDYDATESKDVQVPDSKPYHVGVPRPIVVPIPQPYPIRVPVPKPVAVPVVREITVPIEKPIPFPVFKKVPYPVEKLVPVSVEKQVPVPVVKPYAVPIPQIKPVFHHTRPYREDSDDDHDVDEIDDYQPRPESSKHVYERRPLGTRNRLRRPTRMTYQDRKKARHPQRRPSVNRDHERERTRLRRPTIDYQPHKHHDDDFEDKREHGEFLIYCKRTGLC